MGLAFSRAVDLKMPKRTPSQNSHSRGSSSTPSSTASKVKSVLGFNKLSSSSRQSRSHTNLASGIRPHQNNYRSRLIRDPSRNKQSVFRNQVPSYAGGFSFKSLSSGLSADHSRVLVIEDMENSLGASKSKNVLDRRPDGGTDSTYLFENLSIDYDELESHQALFADEPRQAKAKKFVIAWRQGLSYPKTKKDTVLTDIPIAATSHCKSGINTCTRCYRRHFKRRGGSSEDLLEDLVHKESLEKFIEQNQLFHATSSICIKEDLKRKQLYESVHHADSAEKLEKKDGRSIVPSDEDDDMQLEIQFNLPPPVHIEYIPEKSLFEREMDMELGALKKKSESFSFAHGLKTLLHH